MARKPKIALVPASEIAPRSRPANSTSPYSSRSFYLEDLPSTLYPLTTNRFLVENGAQELLDYAASLLKGDGSFLPQRRVYANKDGIHLRRTVKLDPVAELFLYDIIFRNRAKFRKPHNEDRRHFGYRFIKGRPVAASSSYAEFRRFAADATFAHEEYFYFDISSYFNGIYHHDLHAWFAALKPDDPSDVEAFGRFLREINAGRSLDCLPQGLYPTKMIGNDFLRFLESSATIRSQKMCRFMDDVYIFDDNINVLNNDFAHIQRLLGLKGLSVNASKTKSGTIWDFDDHDETPVSALKQRLLKRRRSLIVSHYDEFDQCVSEADDDEADGDSADLGANGTDAIIPLDDEEIAFVKETLDSEKLTEEDAELLLVVLRDNVSLVEAHLDKFASGYPHLAKNFYGLCAAASDKERVAEVVLSVINGNEHVDEYQLFWFGMMLESYLMDTKHAPALVDSLFKHRSSTDISKSKILEIADLRYGLPEMREFYLREGRSDWLAWASAVGSRAMDRQARNYLLGYFANGSEMNRLISNIVQKN
ncbi:antiviral reverse transcriptase Drt5 [uncultured Sphingomonas sp.]|uniref:antiviral reverse transcriptase Drt5 n=1 Tax=uncultured Sphingomonas sp. TaxID=158754 RepID=UPI0035CC1D0C